MNRILIYTVIAILLGSVTMVVPLALLGSSNLIPSKNHTDTIPESDVETFERDNGSTSPDALSEQSCGIEEYDNISRPSADESTMEGADFAFNLSSIGLMIIPSFLIALGIFVYLKKRMT